MSQGYRFLGSPGLLNSPKTKMINGIRLVVVPYPFVQVSLWRCNLETADWIVVPGAWVPNPQNADGCTPVAFWGLGFGKVKEASTSLGLGPLKLGRLIANGSPLVLPMVGWEQRFCSTISLWVIIPCQWLSGGSTFWTPWFIHKLILLKADRGIGLQRLAWLLGPHCQMTVPKFIPVFLGSLGEIGVG